MVVLLISIGFVAIFFLLMSVRLLFIKGGEFRGTCASSSPWAEQNGETCSFCGKKVDASGACAKDAA